MVYEYSDLVEKAKHWARRAARSGWIDKDQAEQLELFEEKTPDTLFATPETRPLIVAFLGGTGVGKSSLINRLAGDPIARTGVERPTSREVTLYYHQSVLLQKLPLDNIKLSAHDDQQKKNVIWIDMPDMDSTEAKNKQLVLDWLPHIDLLIYVVSPERYKDNKAWQLLLAEGCRHAWIFILNQWDRGQTEQYQDFKHQLAKAGFDDPILLRTICAAGEKDSLPDEFAQLEQTIQQLTDENIVNQLELRGLQVRRTELKQKLQTSLIELGQEEDYQKVQDEWKAIWRATTNKLQQGFEWPLQRLAAYYAKHESNLLGDLVNKLSDSDKQDKEKRSIFWDDWAQSRYDDALDSVILKMDQCQLPVAPIRQTLLPLRTKGKSTTLNQSELAVRQALANPGNSLQRGLLKIASFCAVVLPLAAMGWVGYQVFYGYYESNLTDEAYLGVNFAVHSVLLVALAWLVPYFVQKKLKPSLEKVALQGLKKGLTAGLATIEIEVVRAIDENRHQRVTYIQEANEIIAQCEIIESEVDQIENRSLNRMLTDGNL